MGQKNGLQIQLEQKLITAQRAMERKMKRKNQKRRN